MSECLDKFVQVSGGFQAAVNLISNIDDDDKVSGYIPTHKASEILHDLAVNFHETSKRRSRLITGSYGTGKSHLALVIARIFRDGTEHPALKQVIEKLSRWPSITKQLREERNSRKGKYIVVTILGDAGDFKDTLLLELDKSLQKEGLDLFPDTAFEAAIRRIDEIRRDHPATYTHLANVVTSHGFVSIEALELQLKNKLRTSFDKFLKIHEESCAGAKFYKSHNMKPEEVYKEVSKRLIDEHGYAGIAVIWDEFGRYLQRIVEEPHGKEGEAIQNFADGCCNLQGDAQVHLYLLAHGTLEEFANELAIRRRTTVSITDKSEWGKIEGRFTLCQVKTSTHEIFNLIDHIIIQDEESDEWKKFIYASNDYFDQETEHAKTHRIFPELNREDIHRIVTLGCYPLHPMAAFCLPLISQCVGQDNRTLFTFLSDDGLDTFGSFIRSAQIPAPGAPPPFFTADLLWDYFVVDMEKKPKYRNIFSRFTKASLLVDPDDKLGHRIIKVVALLQIFQSNSAVIRDQSNSGTAIKEDNISYCLATTLSNSSVLKDKLKALCNDKILIQGLDGVYRLPGEVADGFAAELKKTLEARRNLEPINHLRAMLKEHSHLDSFIEASRYELEFSIVRKLVMECVSVKELESPARWLANLGKGEFVDGYALIVMCENTDDIMTARELIKDKLQHPQILFAIPKAGIGLSERIREHEAINHLGKSNTALYGIGAPLREEWEAHYRDYTDHLVKEIETLLVKLENEKLEWILDGEIQPNIRSKSHVSDLASKIMTNVFNMTPKIAHDRLTCDDGNDAFKSYRQSVIDKVLLKDAPKVLVQETLKPQKNIIDNFYKRNGILKIINNIPEVGVPVASEYPAMNAVWMVIEDGIEKARNSNGIPISMNEIINTLRKPPYGLRQRSIPVLIAAVFRKDCLLGNISLLEGTRRSDKINGEMIDKAVFNAGNVKLHFEAFGEIQRAILYGVADTFGLDTSRENDKGELVSEIHEKLKTWYFGLSQYSQTTYQINKVVAAIIRDKIIKKLIDDSSDVYQVLMQDLAVELLKGNEDKRISEQMVASNFKRWKNEIENAVTNRLIPYIKQGVSEVFGASAEQQWGAAMSGWWSNLSQEKREVRIPGDANVLSKLCADNTANQSFTEESLFALAEHFTGMKLNNWKDFTLDQFKGSLGGAKRTIEMYEIPQFQPEPTRDDVPVPEGKVVLKVDTSEGLVTRTFVKVENYSQGGLTFKNTLKGIIEGMGTPLPSGECETILLEVIKEYLK
ncbi:MAG: hypothetical protein JZU65_06030 [Chlorobium sp.]|nr:hypothetical protein [Chlorobium sp.]